jgi:hypothetical protein
MMDLVQWGAPALSAVAGILATAITSMINPDSSRKTKLMWMAGLGAAVVLASSGIYFSRVPHISFEIDQKKPFVINSKDWVFVRLKVTNDNFAEASCLLFLTDMQEDGVPIATDDNIQLSVANRSLDLNAQTIGGSFSMLFDIAYVLQTNRSELKIALPRGVDSQYTTLGPDTWPVGIYDLTVQTNGKNCTSPPYKIRLEFKGWPDLKVLPTAPARPGRGYRSSR